MSSTHSIITPSIMYWGTPVVLVTTENKNGTTNIAPISSAWWLGHRCMLGIAAESQTTINLLRTKQCVLNLPSDDMGHYINAIAKTTGTPELPPIKQALGYEYCQDKFERAGLTRQASGLIRPPRVAECPVQMEAELIGFTEMMKDLPDLAGFVLALEVKILRTHVRHDIRLAGHANRINPDRWRPMIMSFQELYGLAPSKVVKSKLASIDEETYRPLTRSQVVSQGGDMDRVETNDSCLDQTEPYILEV